MIALSVEGLNKTYNNGFEVLCNINLEVKRGEIFALLGPNGAGKTTLINTICGIVTPSTGTIKVFGHDNIKDYLAARSHIGLVPQELTTDAFETVWNTVSFSRGLFGKAPNSIYIREILEKLSLWDKKDSQIRKLSGGMKRRVMIAKALAHEPDILFLDEPSAGVDVELRKSMWKEISKLQKTGVTIILTTHYIEEAEEIADRIGIINKGKLIITEEKASLMKKLGKKELIIDLNKPITKIINPLAKFGLTLGAEGKQVIFTYDPTTEDNQVANLLDHLKQHDIKYKDLNTRQSSLEEIFIQLVGKS
jgi:ABC-2 type transport system ATP-binding protein